MILNLYPQCKHGSGCCVGVSLSCTCWVLGKDSIFSPLFSAVHPLQTTEETPGWLSLPTIYPAPSAEPLGTVKQVIMDRSYQTTDALSSPNLMVFLACLPLKGSAVVWWHDLQITASVGWETQETRFLFLFIFFVHLIVSRLFPMVKGLHKTLMDRFLWLLCQLQSSPSSGFIIQTLEVAD